MGASDIHKLRLRMDAFVGNLDRYVEKVVNYNSDLENLNKDQLRKSTLADGNSMKRPLSPGYAAWKSKMHPSSFGSGDPNWLLSGDLFRNIGITAKGKKYKIISLVPYAAWLIKEFGEGFGIAPKNHPKAQEITTRLLRQEFITNVL